MTHSSDRSWFTGIVPIVVCIFVGCSDAIVDTTSSDPAGQPAAGTTPEILHDDAETNESQDAFAQQRQAMVTRHLEARDIRNQRVLQAMRRVPRHEFVPKSQIHHAYRDSPLPIGHRQTISQPYIVALMTQLVDPKPTDKALDVGTGSGYQAAVLAETVASVYTIEIVAPLAAEAKQRLESLGYKNVQTRQGDGYRGWPEEAPFDIIIVAAAPDHIPQPLIDQLAPGGTLVIPVGDAWQVLMRIDKDKDGVVKKSRVAPVAFVPMTGEAQE